MEDTMSDTTEIPATASRSPLNLRTQIIERWDESLVRLQGLREARAALADEIREAVADVKEQRKLVRVVAPELLNGDHPDE
jgi:hypothetical protein